MDFLVSVTSSSGVICLSAFGLFWAVQPQRGTKEPRRRVTRFHEAVCGRKLFTDGTNPTNTVPGSDIVRLSVKSRRLSGRSGRCNLICTTEVHMHMGRNRTAHQQTVQSAACKAQGAEPHSTPATERKEDAMGAQKARRRARLRNIGRER
jgi:hypothetical protein